MRLPLEPSRPLTAVPTLCAANAWHATDVMERPVAHRCAGTSVKRYMTWPIAVMMYPVCDQAIRT